MSDEWDKVQAIKFAMRSKYRETVNIMLEQRLKAFFKDAAMIEMLRVPIRWGKNTETKERYESFLSSWLNTSGTEEDNSWLNLVKEDGNKFDDNAIKVISKGEVFGFVGYVGKEYTERVRHIMDNSSKFYVMGNDDAIDGQATIEIFYCTKEEDKPPKERE